MFTINLKSFNMFTINTLYSDNQTCSVSPTFYFYITFGTIISNRYSAH